MKILQLVIALAPAWLAVPCAAQQLHQLQYVFPVGRTAFFEHILSVDTESHDGDGAVRKRSLSVTLYGESRVASTEKGLAELDYRCHRLVANLDDPVMKAVMAKDGPAMDEAYDSQVATKVPQGPLVVLWSKVVGKSDKFRVSPVGIVEVGKPDARVGELVEELTRSRLPKGSYEDLLLPVLPVSKVPVGATWKQQLEWQMAELGGLKAEFSFQLADVVGNVARVKVAMAFDCRALEVPPEWKLTVEGDGSFEVDLAEGVATSANSKITVKIRSDSKKGEETTTLRQVVKKLAPPAKKESAEAGGQQQPSGGP